MLVVTGGLPDLEVARRDGVAQAVRAEGSGGYAEQTKDRAEDQRAAGIHGAPPRAIAWRFASRRSRSHWRNSSSCPSA